MRNLSFGIATFLTATIVCMMTFIARTEIRATEEICSIIANEYYRVNEPDVQAFLKRCANDGVPLTMARAQSIKNINRRLSQIHSSHLSVYAPEETIRIWENEGSDTGLRSRMIDSELVVTGTLPESPARRADLRAGDVVVTINDQAPTTDDDARSTAGFYKIARGQQIFQTSLALEDLREDLSPSIVRLNKNTTAVLRIPSFLPQYFENETWLPLTTELFKYQNLIVDLRGNAGGSFPAMLRALTPLFCEVKTAGELWRIPRGDPKPLEKIKMINNLEAREQLRLFESSDTITLETIQDRVAGSQRDVKSTVTQDDAQKRNSNTAVRGDPEEREASSAPCFNRDVIVLIDSSSSSVTEIFADAMSTRARTKIWRNVTAGQVVMARWFSIGSLGGGDYSISIPIAGFRNEHGQRLEQKGVSPSRELYYDLESALRGEDSWINAASVSF